MPHALLDRRALSPADRIAAGFSEELFFRGTLLPILGPLLSALVFALAHVGPHLMRWSVAGYALCVFILGLVMGLLYVYVGLLAAMAANIALDALFLLVLRVSLLKPLDS